MMKGKKQCSHKKLKFSKGNNKGVECVKCGQKWERERKYLTTTMGYKSVTELRMNKQG